MGKSIAWPWRPRTSGRCGFCRDYHSDVPIVMLSSLDSPMDMERSRESGANDHLAKPFDKDQRLAMIAQYSEAGVRG